MVINSIICGKNNEVLKSFPDESVDLILTSPPYDSVRDYKGYEFEFEELSTQLTRVLKQGGVLVWVVADGVVDGSETLTSLKQAIHFKEVCGLRCHDTMIYAKRNYVPTFGKRYEQAWEYMFVFSKGVPKTFNALLKDREWKEGRQFKIFNRGKNDEKEVNPYNAKDQVKLPNIWIYKVAGGHNTSDKIAHEHPAIFPEELAQDHILSWTNEGDIVLDPFNGSGTTCKMAFMLKRNYIGIDISKEYCELAEKRLAPYIRNRKIMGI